MLTPSDLAQLESAGSYYVDRPGAVRRAVGERLAARLGRGAGTRPMAWWGLTHRLQAVERFGKSRVGSRVSGGYEHLLLLGGTGRVSSCGIDGGGVLGHSAGEHVGVPRVVAALVEVAAK